MIASKLASGTKSKVGDAARFVAEQAIQLHGGMGMSDELNVGHYFKRIAAINEDGSARPLPAMSKAVP